MKIVIFDKETKAIRETIQNAEDVEFNGNDLFWSTGSLQGIQDTTQILLLEDTESVPDVETLGDDPTDNGRRKKPKKTFFVDDTMINKDKKEKFRKTNVVDLQEQMKAMQAELEELKRNQT